MKENTLPKVGDVYVNTWGYDQTNVDAYQVVRVTDKSMWLTPIATAVVPGSEGFMSCKVVPTPGSFLPNGFTFRARRVSGGFGLNHGFCKPHVAGATYYNSWYA